MFENEIFLEIMADTLKTNRSEVVPREISY